MQADVLIVGGGLAGLALASNLHKAGIDFQLIEARARFGGRIKRASAGGAGFDLGPSWFWHGQPHMAALVQRFQLQVFEQYSNGDLMFEDEAGQVHRNQGFSSMQGSLRIHGGMAAIIDGLVQSLPANRLHLNTPVTHISHGLVNGGTRAEHIVLAIPPRVAAGIAGLDKPVQNALNAIPTWMGGQAKFLAIYERPFWRDAGQSGDAMSHLGPLVEIHDASALSGQPAALFGFVGVPAVHRLGQRDALIAAATVQLGRLFGVQALHPLQAILADWAFASETASSRDHAPLREHPQYGLPPELSQLWDGHLHFGGSEMAQEFGGYLEGALERAEVLGARLVQVNK